MWITLNRGTTGGSLGLEEFVKVAADAGFEGADVDITWGVAHGAAALEDLYRRQRGGKLKYGAWGPSVDFRMEEPKYKEGLKNAEPQAKLAKQLGLDYAATYLLPSSDMPFIQAWNWHVERLKPIARLMADNGLRYGLEFVAPWHHRRAKKHEFIFTPGLMLELADAIGPNVGLLVDSFHLYTAGTPWIELAQIPKEKIVLCHLNDIADLPPEKVEDFKRLLPGEGVIDLHGYFDALSEAGFDGPIGLEVFSEELKQMSPADAAKRAWKATEKVWKPWKAKAAKQAK
jgi:sugar phosphate isomerase/epimerase